MKGASTRACRTLGDVSRQRVGALWGVCHSAKSCRRGLVGGVLRVICNGICTARFHFDQDEQRCRVGCSDEVECTRALQRLPTTLPTCRILLGSWDAIWHDTIFKMWNRRNRLCILGTGLIDAFVNVSNKHGPYQNNELCFRELMHGRIKMMTRVGPAWSRTHQSLSLGWRPELLGPSRLRLLKPKAKFRQLSASQPPRALLARPRRMVHFHCLGKLCWLRQRDAIAPKRSALPSRARPSTGGW